MIKRATAKDIKGKTQYTVYFKSSPFLGSMNLNGVSPWIVVYYGIIVAQLSISQSYNKAQLSVREGTSVDYFPIDQMIREGFKKSVKFGLFAEPRLTPSPPL